MRAVEYRWTRYRIPFKCPLVTAHGVFSYREGAIVEVTNETGYTGIGEIAPPPGFGSSLDEALAPLSELASNAFPGTYTWTDAYWDALPAATRFGLFAASADYMTQATQGIPTIEIRVPVNATVATNDLDEAIQQARAAISQGIGCIKLKVGMLETVDAEVARVAAMRKAIAPEAHLRLDANEAWDFERARATLDAVARYDIQYCEQPVGRDDLLGMRRLREEQPIPIAADEAISDIASVQRILDERAADVLILKPQCLGGKWDCIRLIQSLPSGSQWVWTTSMETGIGSSATISIAKLLRPQLECGLMTSALLEDDLILTPPTVESGTVDTPYRWGTLDRAALARYAV